MSGWLAVWSIFDFYKCKLLARQVGQSIDRLFDWMIEGLANWPISLVN